MNNSTSAAERARLKRLSMELEPDHHRALKIAAANAGVSIREFVLDLLRREGVIDERAA